MSSPTIPDLPIAPSLNDSDQMLVRQPAGGLGIDKKVTVQELRKINIAGLSPIPNPPNASDYFIISQGGANFQIRFDKVSFSQGTAMWFYQDAAPSGWTAIAESDMLLAVKGGADYPTGGLTGGVWQQKNHTLTLDEIPSHTHEVEGTGTQTASGNLARGHRQSSGTPLQVWETRSSGGGSGHNHGDTWRPAAAVGILCSKD